MKQKPVMGGGRSRPSLRHRIVMGVVSIVMLFVFAPLMMAQNTADILGRTTDASSGVVPGVRVTAKNIATGMEYTSVADSSGNFLVRLLPPGQYHLRAEASGFKTWTVASVTLAGGDRLRQDVQLQVGEVTQTLEVTAEAPSMQTESSSMGNLVTSTAVESLPLNGRNFINLVQLTAGAIDPVGTTASGWATGANPDDRRRTSAVSVNAQPGTANNYMVDGMDNNERFIGSLIIKPSIEAMAEMKVQSSAYSAEVGRVSGGVMNIITKSGTNDLHGSLFEFFRNEQLDAANFFAVKGFRPAYKQNQYGGSVGGPVVKNRTFFFGDFEEYRVVQGVTYSSTVPTAAMKAGNFSGVANIYDPASTTLTGTNAYTRTAFPNNIIPESRMDSPGKMLANMYPDPTTSIGATSGIYTQSPSRTQKDDTFDVRVDHSLSPNNLLFGRYSFNDTTTVTPSQFPADSKSGLNPVGGSNFAGNALQRSQNATTSLTHTFSPKLVGEFKFAYSRIAIHSLPANDGTNAGLKLGIKNTNLNSTTSQMPYFTIADYQIMGDTGYIPLITYNNLFQPAANLLYATGTHSIKFGADMRARQVAQFQSSYGVGNFGFNQFLTNDPSTGLGGNSVASLLTGYPASTSRSLYLVSIPGYRIKEYATFFQDDWRAKSWLTLNLGFRYDYFGPISESYNRISNFDPENAKIVIAGQDGVSSSAGVRKDMNNFEPRVGFAATFGKSWVLRGGYGISYSPALMGSDQAFRNAPFSSTYSVVTSTPGLPANRLSDGLPVPVANSVTNPSGSLSAVAFSGATPYVHQYNVTLQRQLPFGLTATASYVGVIGRDVVLSVPINDAAPGVGTVQQRRPYYSRLPNMQGIAMYGPTYESRYHALQANVERRFARGFGVLANYTWGHAIDSGEVRFRSDNSRYLVNGNAGADIRHRFTVTSNYQLPLGKNIIGRDWQMNVIAILQSGIGMTISNSVTSLNGGGPSRANLIGDPHLSSSERTLDRWFNTSAFSAPPAYIYGTATRGAFAGPGRVNFDVSLRRDFAIMERLRLQFRVEAFNLANTPPFSNPGTAFGSSTFGKITAAGDPRRVQLALKITF